METTSHSPTQEASRRALWLAGMAIFALCLWLRLDQFCAQLVTDDEWHAVHQLILHPPASFFFSFGAADYSIPLALFYWCEAQLFGLSELAMRWPMMLAGLATVVLFPLWALRRYGWRTALVFALLLAISPMLINYSRFARPYALTLLLGYLVHAAFWRFWAREGKLAVTGSFYVLGSALCAWLHLIALPFVIAPLLTAAPAAILAWWRGDRSQFDRLLMLGLATATLTAVLILPPLLGDAAALLGKTSVHAPNIDTFKGIWHMWLGSPSKPAVLFCLVLAIAGFPAVFRQGGMLVRSASVGLGLTLVLILLSGPAWIQNPLTLARYLLPAIALLLLAVAIGAVRLAELAAGRLGAGATTLVMMLPVAALLVHTPLAQTMRQPNSNTLHSEFQTDYRTHREGVAEFMRRAIPLSPWWQTLHGFDDGLLVAVAPYHFVSYLWDAPRWEEMSGHRVLPGALTGLCVDWREGEVPRDARFRLRNAVHLADADALTAKGIAYVVWQKPFTVVLDDQRAEIGTDTAQCLDSLRARFGNASYEDDKIVVFSLKQTVAAGAHAQ